MTLNFIKENNEKAPQSSAVSCYRISSQSMSLNNNFQIKEKLREEAKYLMLMKLKIEKIDETLKFLEKEENLRGERREKKKQYQIRFKKWQTAMLLKNYKYLISSHIQK